MYKSDIPCHKDGNRIVHITVSGVICLCGKKWGCGDRDRHGKVTTVLYRDLNDVTCKECLRINKEEK
ncbi:hypothetical protein D3C81_07890 [compost metagenome]